MAEYCSHTQQPQRMHRPPTRTYCACITRYYHYQALPCITRYQSTKRKYVTLLTNLCADWGKCWRVWCAQMRRGESKPDWVSCILSDILHRERPPRCAPMRSVHISRLLTWHRNVTSERTQAAGVKTTTKPTRWLGPNFHSHPRAQGINLIYAGGHCHAPSCISMELFHADTGKLLCAHYPTYGQTHQVQ